jgi:hypothetical protein
VQQENHGCVIGAGFPETPYAGVDVAMAPGDRNGSASSSAVGVVDTACSTSMGRDAMFPAMLATKTPDWDTVTLADVEFMLWQQLPSSLRRLVQ